MLLASTKRRPLTIDDLLRKQEESPRKRAKLSEEPASEEEDGTESDSDEVQEDASPEAETNRPFQFSRVHEKTVIESPALSQSKETFGSLGVSQVLQNALGSMSIRLPTEIQAACIPPLLAGAYIYILDHISYLVDDPGRDCIGNAKTGSGKTVAFAIPILQKLSADPYGLFALVLTPTRYVEFVPLHGHILTPIKGN